MQQAVLNNAVILETSLAMKRCGIAAVPHSVPRQVLVAHIAAPALY